MLNLLVFLFLLVFKEKSTSLSHKTASQPKAAVYLRPLNGSVAQLDRASDYGSEGLGFESLRDRANNQGLSLIKFLIIWRKFQKNFQKLSQRIPPKRNETPKKRVKPRCEAYHDPPLFSVFGI